jgi:hypothetical protein
VLALTRKPIFLNLMDDLLSLHAEVGQEPQRKGTFLSFVSQEAHRVRRIESIKALVVMQITVRTSIRT